MPQQMMPTLAHLVGCGGHLVALRATRSADSTNWRTGISCLIVASLTNLWRGRLIATLTVGVFSMTYVLLHLDIPVKRVI